MEGEVVDVVETELVVEVVLLVELVVDLPEFTKKYAPTPTTTIMTMTTIATAIVETDL